MLRRTAVTVALVGLVLLGVGTRQTSSEASAADFASLLRTCTMAAVPSAECDDGDPTTGDVCVASSLPNPPLICIYIPQVLRTCTVESTSLTPSAECNQGDPLKVDLCGRSPQQELVCVFALLTGIPTAAAAAPMLTPATLSFLVVVLLAVGIWQMRLRVTASRRLQP